MILGILKLVYFFMNKYDFLNSSFHKNFKDFIIPKTSPNTLPKPAKKSRQYPSESSNVDRICDVTWPQTSCSYTQPH